jgi:transcription initiation factor IIE alpha subunit
MLNGIWRFMFKVPPALWEKQIKKHRRRVLHDLDFMTPGHRRVHHFTVNTIPGRSTPLPPEEIAGALNIEISKVNDILADLEQHMTFLFRDHQGAVTWAYPVTVEKTPHHLTFDDGRTCFAA